MSACQRKVVAPAQPARALSAPTRQRQVKLQDRTSRSRRQNVRVTATAENPSVSLPIRKQILTWVGSWAGSALGRREQIVYSSSVPTGAHLVDVAEMWAREHNRPELLDGISDIASDEVPRPSSGLAQVQKALTHSFSVSTAYAEITEIRNGEVVCTSRKLIGCARCVSDGYFAAEVVDCCIDPAFQRRGIGTKLLRKLCKDTKAAGAQSIAVFSAPDSRLFFWKAGFRMDFRYKIMVYNTLKPAPIASSASTGRSSDVSVQELSEIFGSARR